MKKIIAAVVAIALLSCALCSRGKKEKPLNTTTGIISFKVDQENADEKITFKFEIDEAYTYMLISTENGLLYPEEGREEDAHFTDNYLRLENGAGFSWFPNKNSDKSTATISIQICNIDSTIHCGTISLKPILNLLDTEAPNEYAALMESDDGLAIKQEKPNETITIFVKK